MGNRSGLSILPNLHIGARLGVGFALILLLSIVSTTFALVNARAAAEATRRMMAEPLAKERLAADLRPLISAGIWRTAMIARSSDETLAITFAPIIAEGTRQGGALIKKIEAQLTTDAEKAAFATVIAHRNKFQAAKQVIMSAKKAGKLEEGERVYVDTFEPEANAYQAGVAALVDLQRRAIDATARQIERDNARNLTLEIVLCALMVAFGGACAYLISRSITVPLQQAVEIATTVAGGDLTTVFDTHGRDEVGDLMRALEAMNGALERVVSHVQRGTQAIDSASGEIAAGNLDLSARTEQQASSLEETASSMEELTSTVRQNADNAHQANDLAVSASTVAGRGGDIVSRVIATMGAIDASSRKIVDIISVIDGIAFQTNILALNAAVEAARAGEQGRGFAVVAAEVRNLAQRSAGAAKEIKTLIGDSVEQVNVGTRLVQEAGSTMNEVVASVARVTDIMAGITAASREQTAGIEQVNQAIAQMDQVTQQNAALVEQAAAAAVSMQDQAHSLAEVAAGFRLAAAQAPAARAAVRPVPARAGLALR